MKIFKTKIVKTPERGTLRSAGIDFFIPEFTDDFIVDFLAKNTMYINIEDRAIDVGPNEHILIPSGIKVSIPEGHALIAYNKSGISTKYGMDVLACVIDEDYQGEVHISMVNTSKSIVTLYASQKIVQFILIKVNYAVVQEVKDMHIMYDNVTIRGEKGFGSTGI